MTIPRLRNLPPAGKEHVQEHADLIEQISKVVNGRCCDCVLFAIETVAVLVADSADPSLITDAAIEKRMTAIVGLITAWRGARSGLSLPDFLRSQLGPADAPPDVGETRH